MKPLLLIGAALMAGAGIYGFVDYKKTNLRKEFQTLYKEGPTKDVQVSTPAPPEVDPVPTDVPVYVVKNGKVVPEKPAVTEKKLSKKPKKLRKEQFSRAAMEEFQVEVPLEPEKKVKQP
jgi:hypothetical protein